MIPVKAMANGRLVVAFGRGGVTETDVDGVIGILFAEQTVDAQVDALDRCERAGLDPDAAVARARNFGLDVFQTAMAGAIRRAVEAKVA